MNEWTATGWAKTLQGHQKQTKLEICMLTIVKDMCRSHTMCAVHCGWLAVPLLFPLHLVVVDRDNDECLAMMSSGKETRTVNVIDRDNDECLAMMSSGIGTRALNIGNNEQWQRDPRRKYWKIKKSKDELGQWHQWHGWAGVMPNPKRGRGKNPLSWSCNGCNSQLLFWTNEEKECKKNAVRWNADNSPPS